MDFGDGRCGSIQSDGGAMDLMALHRETEYLRQTNEQQSVELARLHKLEQMNAQACCKPNNCLIF